MPIQYKYKLYYEEEARKKIRAGVEKLKKAVATTLGPKGRNVGIVRLNPAGPSENIILHDGVKVANSIALEDTGEHFAMAVVRESAQKQVDEVGDGTTVTIILAHAILDEALKLIAAGLNPMSLRHDLENASEELIDTLGKFAKDVKTLDQKIDVATISAQDIALGKMIAETYHKIGVEGVLTVEESKSDKTFMEHQEGMQFDSGYMSPFLVTDPSRMSVTIENPYIVLCDRNIVNIPELLPFLNDKLLKVSKNLVIIAPDITDTAFNSLVLTKMKGGMNINLVRAPMMGNKQKEFLQDIAVLTGGQVVSEEAGMRFEDLELDVCGRADKITSTRDATIIISGKGDKKKILERVESLKAQLNKEEGTDFEREKLHERIAKLTNGIAVLKVGGHTEIEMKERKERALDSISATKVAIEEGIVPGGEIVYLYALELLGNKFADKNAASGILSRAVKTPFEVLMFNAGYSADKKWAEVEHTPNKTTSFGVDVSDGKIKDLLKTGIIDPLKVCKSAISNAVSVAVQLMTVECLNVPEEVKRELGKQDFFNV